MDTFGRAGESAITRRRYLHVEQFGKSRRIPTGKVRDVDRSSCTRAHRLYPQKGKAKRDSNRRVGYRRPDQGDF